jgi:membrane protease YdiL (CAAX protease family)
MKQLMTKILAVPFVSYFLMMPVIIILEDILGSAWIRDTLNYNALPVWIVLTFVLIVFVIAQHAIRVRGQK